VETRSNLIQYVQPHSVLIVGFNNYNELSSAMEKVIKETQTYLFSIVVGGIEYSSYKTLAEQWAINNGAGIIRIYDSDFDRLIWKLHKEVDYIVIKIDNDTPNVWKRFMEQMVREGKHGKVIR